MQGASKPLEESNFIWKKLDLAIFCTWGTGDGGKCGDIDWVDNIVNHAEEFELYSESQEKPLKGLMRSVWPDLYLRNALKPSERRDREGNPVSRNLSHGKAYYMEERWGFLSGK